MVLSINYCRFSDYPHVLGIFEFNFCLNMTVELFYNLSVSFALLNYYMYFWKIRGYLKKFWK